MPAGTGKFPMILVAQEILGVHEHIKDMCRRFAVMGYDAIAPEIHARIHRQCRRACAVNRLRVQRQASAGDGSVIHRWRES